jgi:hypothetical protein
VTSGGTMKWTVASTIDKAGNPAATVVVTETGAADKDF